MTTNRKQTIFIFVIVVAIGAAFFVSTRKNYAPSPTQTADQTSNWKTYTDSQSGFSLKYPSDYFKYPGNPPGGLYVATLAPVGGNGPKFLGDDALWFSASSTDSKLTLDQYVATEEAVTDSLYKNAQKVPFTVDGVPGYKITHSYQAFPAGNSNDNTVTSTTIYNYQTWIMKDGKIYMISLSAYNEKLLNSQQIMYDQILSTFKFLSRSKDSIPVKLFYNDPKLDPKLEFCEARDYIKKEIPKTDSPVKDTINTLIRSDIFERDYKFILKSINLKQDGTLLLEFPFIGGFTTGGSCRIGILTSQIKNTALQFPEVKKVIFEPDVFQP